MPLRCQMSSVMMISYVEGMGWEGGGGSSDSSILPWGEGPDIDIDIDEDEGRPLLDHFFS